MSVQGNEHVDPLGIYALGAAAIAACSGYLASRKSKPDQAATLIDAATKLATAAIAADKDTREALAEMRHDLEAVRRMVDECEERHLRAETALRAAGIALTQTGDDHG